MTFAMDVFGQEMVMEMNVSAVGEPLNVQIPSPDEVMDVTGLAVAPGFIDTRMSRSVPEKALQNMISHTPLRRLGDVEEVAEAYVWLASDRARGVGPEARQFHCRGRQATVAGHSSREPRRGGTSLSDSVCVFVCVSPLRGCRMFYG